jgi:heme/copper-type cytochrome/quinol oxidase subunit 4
MEDTMKNTTNTSIRRRIMRYVVTFSIGYAYALMVTLTNIPLWILFTIGFTAGFSVVLIAMKEKEDYGD